MLNLKTLPKYYYVTQLPFQLVSKNLFSNSNSNDCLSNYQGLINIVFYKNTKLYF